MAGYSDPQDIEGYGTVEESGRFSLRTLRQNARSIAWRRLLNARMWGFAFSRAWVYLMFFGAATSIVTWDGAPMPASVFTISTMALFFTMNLAALRSDAFESLMYRPNVRWAAPLLTCAGTIAAACSTTADSVSSQVVTMLVGGILTGIGSGMISLGYGEAYRNVSSRQTSLETPLSFLIAAVVFLAISQTTAPAVACVITSMLPLISCFLLFHIVGVWNPHSFPATKPVSIPISAVMLRIGICAALVGVADGVVRAVFISMSGSSVQQFYQVPLLWASLITLVVIWGCILISRVYNLLAIYRMTLIIIAFFFQLLPIFIGSYFENILALAGYGTFNVLIWILLADVTYTYRLSSALVFGSGWSMITLGVFLGSWGGELLVNTLAPFQPQVISAVALASTMTVALSYAFVLKESDLIKLTNLAESNDDVNDVVTTRSSTADSGKTTAVAVGIGDDAGSRRNSRNDGTTDHVPRFTIRCREVAMHYGLSDRETEIMTLYAKGRSYARLQEELSLSRGTVTTHLRHIYQKLDVHSKQEMLDLIEGRTATEQNRI